MKIAVIGHFCFDIIHEGDGNEIRVLGGIYHAIAAMSYLADEHDSIVPVFGVGKEDFEEVIQKLGLLKNVRTDGIYPFEGKSNYVHYRAAESGVMTHHVSESIPFHRIKKYLNVDGVYINMISGSDISIETLDEIRLEIRPKRIPIHIDIHSLTLHVTPEGKRSFRPMSDWRRWCFMIDSVQMNEEEAKNISVEQFSDELLAKQMIPLMVRAFMITRGRNGVTLYKADHKYVIEKEFKAEGIDNPVSEIGSGDIFGASYLVSYLKKKNYENAVQFAVKAASLTTQYSVSEKHRYLADLRAEA